MARTRISRPAAAYARPACLESPLKGGQANLRQWFKIANLEDDELDGDSASVPKEKDADTTHVYIYDEIGGWFGVWASEFINAIKNIKTKSITLHINSPGGDYFDGVAIYNSLRAHPAEVHVVVDALAASAASFIAQAGDTVTMNRGSMMMIHDASAMAYDNAEGMREIADVLDKVSNSCADIYAARAGGDPATWRATMKTEAWFSAQEAVDAGLADQVDEQTEAPDVTNKWDFSIYNFAGRSKAPNPMTVMNKAKEAGVTAKPKNNAPNSDDSSGTEVPAAQGSSEQNDESAGVGDAVSNDENGDGTQAAPETPPSQGDNNTGPQNRATLPSQAAGLAILCNGQRLTDAVAIQNHINVLETFQREQKEAGRKAFVEQLAADNKIAATQIDKLQAFALKQSDEAFEEWKATWDEAPKSSMFSSVTGGTTNHGGDDTPKDALEAKLETAEDVVKHHRNSGMPEEAIKNTPSYKLLAEHGRV